MTDATESPPPKSPQPETQPPRVKPRIIAAPKLGQIYWCDFPRDAHLPEMWKTRPVVVMSYKNSLHGPCLVVPLSTEPQGNSPWAWELSSSLDGQRSWVVCNHLYTVAPSRFSQIRGKIPSIPKADFNEVLKRVQEWLPRPFDLDK
ncbi:type II toxin-antitoxin system PemK/MazF family toxin [Acidisoma cladoniae]|uniref:type II toxin-antitoxin system PemK/MazF family toxin n=1 Tax=Acidisoma cladoniae TaxID=3040935 RepID=UPI00254A4DF2|nr:type II toxin-antitoxin system PemK/MazF family toxin [Acidisoma sp. PAMC 29798]